MLLGLVFVADVVGGLPILRRATLEVSEFRELKGMRQHTVTSKRIMWGGCEKACRKGLPVNLILFRNLPVPSQHYCKIFVAYGS
jgi:hypothetical protein